MENEIIKEKTYKGYLRDLGYLLKEMGLEAKKEYEQSKGTENEAHKCGYFMGFHRVLTLMHQQAEGFQIPLSDLTWNDFDPDDDLI